MTILQEHKKIIYQDGEYTLGVRDNNNWVIMDTEKHKKYGWTNASTYGYYSSLESLLINFIRLTAFKSLPKEPFKSIDGITNWYSRVIIDAIKRYFPKIEV